MTFSETPRWCFGFSLCLTSVLLVARHFLVAARTHAKKQENNPSFKTVCCLRPPRPWSHWFSIFLDNVSSQGTTDQTNPPPNRTPEERLLYRNNIAIALMEQFNFREALGELAQCSRIDPKFVPAW